MVNAIQVIGTVLIFGLIGGGALVMHKFFGLVGVGLLIAFLLPVLGVIVYFGNAGGGGGGGGTHTSNRRSKGARQSQED